MPKVIHYRSSQRKRSSGGRKCGREGKLSLTTIVGVECLNTMRAFRRRIQGAKVIILIDSSAL